MMNKRILIAMDDSDSSEFVFEQAFLIAQEHKSSLKLLHVLNSQDQNLPSNKTLSDQLQSTQKNSDVMPVQKSIFPKSNSERRILRRLVGCVERAKAARIDADYICIIGEPGQLICDLALSWRADLIVLGGEEPASDSTPSHNSVRNHVTHHAPCSVEVARLSRNQQPSNSLENEVLYSHLSGWQ
ncbi:universal stress protein (plasmid) [Acaryochloris sp. 'Moss Beach']|nr:universal stress protein [Acaryochloris marina S15]UJB72619.1 universal stress protein [Acaryochloris sp. 'Moss Beach']